jgi:hypothetical protein
MAGKRALIVKALYGLKSSGRQWHKCLSDILRGLGWLSSRFDADVWYRLNVKTDLYEYIGTHTDDLLIVAHLGHQTKSLKNLGRVSPSSRRVNHPTI